MQNMSLISPLMVIVVVKVRSLIKSLELSLEFLKVLSQEKHLEAIHLNNIGINMANWLIMKGFAR